MTVVRKISDHRDYKQQEATPSVDKGFALFHRKIMDCGFYKDSQAVHLWFHLVMKATHKPIVSTTEFGDIRLERGQCITGRHKLASETGISPDRIQYLLRKFISMGMVSAESNRKFTVISILKYDEYQADYLPTDYQQITNANPHGTKAAVKVVPTDSQQITTYNELLTNNSISKDIECASAQQDKPKKTPTLSCQDVVDAYHELLPDSPKVRALNDKRKNKIRTFWAKAGKITRQLDGKPFSMQAWRDYLSYISSNCTWMICQRDNQRNGTTWHKKDIDYMLSDDVYLKVREGGHDDR